MEGINNIIHQHLTCCPYILQLAFPYGRHLFLHFGPQFADFNVVLLPQDLTVYPCTYRGGYCR